MKEVFEKIIERLRYEKEIDRSKVYNPAQCDAIRYSFGAAIDAVKTIAEKYDNGWIPCSEKYPPNSTHCKTEDCKPVFVTYKSIYDEKYFVAGTLALYIGDGEWKWFDETIDVSDMEDVVCKIIAWQPLPEPYQPKGE